MLDKKCSQNSLILSTEVHNTSPLDHKNKNQDEVVIDSKISQ